MVVGCAQRGKRTINDIGVNVCICTSDAQFTKMIIQYSYLILMVVIWAIAITVFSLVTRFGICVQIIADT